MLTILFALFHIFTCDHDREMAEFLRTMPPRPIRKAKKIKASDPQIIQDEINRREPIRVQFNMASIDNPSLDQYQCKSVGQSIVDPSRGVSTTCTDEDLMNDQKRSVLMQTMNAAQDYIHRLIKVTPRTSPIDISRSSLAATAGGISQVDNCDLFIFVLARPYNEGSTTLASATYEDVNFDYTDQTPLDAHRPIRGRIFVNPRRIPSRAQNENSGERQFFITCLHELMHVLAFSSSLFGDWINRSSGMPYDGHYFSFKNNYGITQTFINTPRLTEWVNNRFQVIDESISHFGLEIEDNGGSGTKGSHPNARLYFSDIMQGRTYGPGVVSPIFFYSLEDSGWYEPNYTMMEELVYMNMDIYDEAPNQYVLTNPGGKTFPESYFCNNIYAQYCFYDYSYKAACDNYDASYVYEYESTHQTSGDILSNNATVATWYGYNGIYGSDDLLDYLPLRLPTVSNCRDPNLPQTNEDVGTMATKMKENYSENSVCAISTIFSGGFGEVLLAQTAGCYQARCGADGKLRMTLPGTREQVCVREDQRLYRSGSLEYILCPNARAACANLPKTPMVTIEQIIPDRGPYDGSNFVKLEGHDLLSFGISDIKIGPVSIMNGLISYSDTYYLIQIPSNIAATTQPLIGSAQNLTVIARDPQETIFEEFYTFLNREYSNPN